MARALKFADNKIKIQDARIKSLESDNTRLITDNSEMRPRKLIPNLLVGLVTAFTVAFFFYVCFSIMGWDYDPGGWDTEYRIAYTSISALVGFVAGVIAISIKAENERGGTW